MYETTNVDGKLFRIIECSDAASFTKSPKRGIRLIVDPDTGKEISEHINWHVYEYIIDFGKKKYWNQVEVYLSGMIIGQFWNRVTHSTDRRKLYQTEIAVCEYLLKDTPGNTIDMDDLEYLPDRLHFYKGYAINEIRKAYKKYNVNGKRDYWDFTGLQLKIDLLDSYLTKLKDEYEKIYAVENNTIAATNNNEKAVRHEVIDPEFFGKTAILKLLSVCGKDFENWQIPNILEDSYKLIPDDGRPEVYSNRFNFLQQLTYELGANATLFKDREDKFRTIEKWVRNEMANGQVVVRMDPLKFEPDWKEVERENVFVENERPLGLFDIFESVSKCNYILNLLVDKEHCQLHTYIWKDENKGNKGFLVAILKYLHTQKYYKENKALTIQQIKEIAKNTFGWNVSIDTIKKTKPQNFDLSFIPPASTIN